MALGLLLLWMTWLQSPRHPLQTAGIALLRRPLSRWLRTAPLVNPKIHPWMLPYAGWADEYRVYFQRLAHSPSNLFAGQGHIPTMIVMHYTVTSSASGVWNSFARGSRMDTGDYGFPFGHPSVHFIVDRDGAIYQLLPTSWRCTGAYGVNQVALSIEMVALNDDDLLSRPGQIYASFCLVRSLMRHFQIPLSRVVGHIEVSCGKLVVPDYLDYADSHWPYCYPPTAFRFDPGMTYMGWLRRRFREPL